MLTPYTLRNRTLHEAPVPNKAFLALAWCVAQQHLRLATSPLHSPEEHCATCKSGAEYRGVQLTFNLRGTDPPQYGTRIQIFRRIATASVDHLHAPGLEQHVQPVRLALDERGKTSGAAARHHQSQLIQP